MSISVLATLGRPCPESVHTSPPVCFPYLIRSGSAYYVCFDCGYGWPVTEQEESGTGVLSQEAGTA